MSTSSTYPRGQVYFLSHGGPPTMFDTDSAAYKAWQKYGKVVADQHPRGLVVVSAHWESEGDEILSMFRLQHTWKPLTGSQHRLVKSACLRLLRVPAAVLQADV